MLQLSNNDQYHYNYYYHLDELHIYESETASVKLKISQADILNLADLTWSLQKLNNLLFYI
jgi:hypothetical protein